MGSFHRSTRLIRSMQHLRNFSRPTVPIKKKVKTVNLQCVPLKIVIDGRNKMSTFFDYVPPILMKIDFPIFLGC